MVFNLCSRNIRTFKIPLPPFLHRSGRVHYTAPHLSLAFPENGHYCSLVIRLLGPTIIINLSRERDIGTASE